MKRFYSQSRIMLMTFAVGLASVFVFNGSLEFSDEVPVVLPKSQSKSPIIIFPTDERCSNYVIRGRKEWCNKERLDYLYKLGIPQNNN
ncbi:MAG: hypothetical protein M3033_12740 [Acidobacteriota bacterium]|nr:hypothetical protein [Acidobacteriota bacterium]